MVMLLLAACGPEPPPPPATPRPTQSTQPSPTADLPLAKPAASPSVAPESGAVPGGQAFVLTSTSFGAGGTIPADNTCDGVGQSPPLAWSGQPAGTRAYALLAQDMDIVARNQPLTQWLLYNLPAGTNQLAAGQPTRPLLQNGAQQGQNGKATVGYLAPCPNRGEPPHHLVFQLFAQDGYLTLQTGATDDEVRTALAGHILGQTTLAATVQR